MISIKKPYEFQSINAAGFEGYLYRKSLSVSQCTLEGERYYAAALDRYLAGKEPGLQKLTDRNLSEWLGRRPNEKKITQKKRLDFTKRLCSHMQKTDPTVEMPSLVIRDAQTDYVPYIFTADELRRIFAAAEQYQPTIRSPYLNLSVPAAFRMLYGCGLRSSELVSLKLDDVDMENRTLYIRNTKFGKSRYVPFSASLGAHIQHYTDRRFPEKSHTGLWFLSSEDNNAPYTVQAIRVWLMNLLHAAGISHGGRGCGPRVHDFRHTFAVHSMQRCFREKGDPSLILPMLSTYLGHKDLRGTQYYLRLMAEAYPDILNALKNRHGSMTGGDADES